MVQDRVFDAKYCVIALQYSVYLIYFESSWQIAYGREANSLAEITIDSRNICENFSFWLLYFLHSNF